MTKRAALYLRVSTEHQAREGFSLPEQRRSLTAYAKAQGWKIVETFEDSGISGATIEGRPAMSALLRAIQERQFDVVLVAEWERLSRSPHARDWPVILDACESAGVILATPQGRLDPRNLEDAFLSGLFGLLSARERAKIARRTLKGKVERVQQGHYLPSGGNAPYGYRYCKDDGLLHIEPSEGLIVRRIFELYLAGESLHGVVRALHAEGHEPRSAKRFHVKIIRGVLTNSVYVGLIGIGREKRKGLERYLGLDQPIERRGKHEALVDRQTFGRVQARLLSRQGNRAGKGYRNSPHFLTSIIRCPVCGEGMVGNSYTAKGRVYSYYRCSRNTGGDHHGSVRTTEPEEAVLSRLERLGTDEEFLEEARRRILLDRMRSGTNEASKAADLRAEVERCRQREVSAYEDKADGTLSPAQFKRIAAALASKRERAEAQLQEAEDRLLRCAEGGGADIHQTLEVLRHLRAVFGACSPLEKREVVRALVSRVERSQDDAGRDRWVVSFREPWSSILEPGEADEEVSRIG